MTPYNVKSVTLPSYRIRSKMTTTISSGLEARYQAQLIKAPRPTGKTIADVDTATNVASKFRDVNEVVRVQQKNIDSLLGIAESSLGAVRILQQKTGVKQVNVLGPVTGDIRKSYGKKMGYIRLSLLFLSEVLVASLEENLEAREDIARLYRAFDRIAGYDDDLNLIGGIQEIDLDDLDSASPVAETKTDLSGSDTEYSDNDEDQDNE